MEAPDGNFVKRTLASQNRKPLARPTGDLSSVLSSEIPKPQEHKPTRRKAETDPAAGASAPFRLRTSTPTLP
jgi:hypothetical protein